MKFVYLALGWLFGLFFLVLGISTLFSLGVLPALALLAIAMLLLPPVRAYVHTRYRRTLPSKSRALAIIGLLLAFGMLSGYAEDQKRQELAAREAQEKAEQAEKERREAVAFFNANREDVLSDVRGALQEGDFKRAVATSAKFLPAGDKDLASLNKEARAALAEAERKRKTDKLLAEVKQVPASELQKNVELYQQLAGLNPGNETYEEKIAFYTAKIERAKKIESQFSQWDGSHRNLERVIKRRMNDPSSYEHVETKYSDRGSHLVVQTTFRGKNAFGGLILDSVTAKVALDGTVLEILE